MDTSSSTQTAASPAPFPGRIRPPRAISWSKVRDDLAPIACDIAPASVRRKSRDYFWFSPVLNARLDGRFGDLIAQPKDEAELQRLAAYCVTHGLPVLPRGGGTGNYGQAVPLHGGVVADMTAMNKVIWVKDGVIRAQAGAILAQMDAEAFKSGLELRFFPSTWKTATIGGFVGGGSSGVGGINYGSLFQPGNVLGVRLLTMEDEPRFIELRGADVFKAVHAYGVTGLITEVEIALAPRQAWWEYIVTFGDFSQAMAFADGVARNAAFAKRELAIFDWSAGRYLDHLEPYRGEGEAMIIAVVAAASRESLKDAARMAGGRVTFERAADEASRDPQPLHEYCWNHTTMHALKHDRGVTYLQSLFYRDDYLKDVRRLVDLFGEEVPAHLEYSNIDGQVRCFGMQLVRFTNEARLNEIIRLHNEYGCHIYNPHTYCLDNEAANAVFDAFKRQSDPYGLLNPGKLPGWDAPSGGFFRRADEA